MVFLSNIDMSLSFNLLGSMDGTHRMCMEVWIPMGSWQRRFMGKLYVSVDHFLYCNV